MGRMKKGEPGHDLAYKKFLENMIKKHGNEEAYREHMKKIGALGGSKPTVKPKGFAANPELARKAGAIGGRISRRGKAKEAK